MALVKNECVHHIDTFKQLKRLCNYIVILFSYIKGEI